MRLQLYNHIAYRFLTDEKFTDEILFTIYPKDAEKITNDNFSDVEDRELTMGRVGLLYRHVSIFDQKAYYITDTVMDKLDMLKVSKQDGRHDWTVFNSLQNQKITFILRDNKVLRIMVVDDAILFFYVEFKRDTSTERKKKIGYGNANFVMFYVDRKTGEECEHFAHKDVKAIDGNVYKLLCFFFLTDNEEITVQAGRSYGTKKQADAISNDLNVPVTIVNSRWNITSIRTEGFGVRGHFAIRRCGKGYQDARIVFIEPFMKHGYVRRAGKEISE